MRKLKITELNRLSPEEFKATTKIDVTIVLDNIRSLHNVGSIFRTADAFCMKKIILCGITATPPHNEIHKTALGAEDTVSWEYYKSTKEAINKLKQENHKIIGIEQVDKGKDLTHFRPEKGEKLVIIFGNEVKGVQQEVIDLCDFCIEIPQFGTKHSLNVSVSAGIVLWEILKSNNLLLK